MEAVDVARVRTQVRLVELALLGLIAENQGRVDDDQELDRWLYLTKENLEYAKSHLTIAIDTLNAGKPPRERG
jgi:hypothetical protein